jgi:hypothetical protein
MDRHSVDEAVLIQSNGQYDNSYQSESTASLSELRDGA